MISKILFQAVAKVADYWLDVLYSKGANMPLEAIKIPVGRCRPGGCMPKYKTLNHKLQPSHQRWNTVAANRSQDNHKMPSKAIKKESKEWKDR